MSVVISGKVTTATSAGTVTGQNLKSVYLKPSRTDFQFSLDLGVTWETWEGDPNLANTYPGAIAATTDVNGNYSFTVPWTDDPNETRLPGGALVPDLFWNIIDPNPTSGTIAFWGKTDTAIVGAAKTIKELITLALPDTWQVGSVAYAATPYADERFGAVSFTSSSTTGALTFPSIGTSDWSFSHGIESDDTNQYTVRVNTASKTDTGCTLELSDLPDVGKTVKVWFRVRPN